MKIERKNAASPLKPCAARQVSRVLTFTTCTTPKQINSYCSTFVSLAALYSLVVHLRKRARAIVKKFPFTSYSNTSSAWQRVIREKTGKDFSIEFLVSCLVSSKVKI